MQWNMNTVIYLGISWKVCVTILCWTIGFVAQLTLYIIQIHSINKDSYILNKYLQWLIFTLSSGVLQLNEFIKIEHHCNSNFLCHCWVFWTNYFVIVVLLVWIIKRKTDDNYFVIWSFLCIKLEIQFGLAQTAFM